MKEWYKAAVDRTPPPARVTLERITEESVALYCQVQPPGEIIPLYAYTSPVEVLVPTE